MIALCLQTCDRPGMTARTLESFAIHHDLKAFALLHADDASETAENRALAQYYGFKTVVQSAIRQGMLLTRTMLIEFAAKRHEWILLLENDIETVRPVPVALFRYMLKWPSIYCLRLYGRYKDRDRIDACLTTHKREGHHYVYWKPFKGAPEKSQLARIHWSAQPAITRSKELRHLHRTGDEPDGYTVRVKKNVTFHVGAERTPGRIK